MFWKLCRKDEKGFWSSREEIVTNGLRVVLLGPMWTP